MNVQSVLSIFTAMLTPAVLILATGSLLLTTSNRATRVIDRIREMMSEVERLVGVEDAVADEKRTLLFAQIQRSTLRARFLQRALSLLYLALGMFVVTSISIGVLTLTALNLGWLLLILGFLGTSLLLAAVVTLIRESRLALANTYAEMDYVSRMFAKSGNRAG